MLTGRPLGRERVLRGAGYVHEWVGTRSEVHLMPVAKHRDYLLTPERLQQDRDAAWANAQQLLAEATLLLQDAHRACASFLAVASMEFS